MVETVDDDQRHRHTRVAVAPAIGLGGLVEVVREPEQLDVDEIGGGTADLPDRGVEEVEGAAVGLGDAADQRLLALVARHLADACTRPPAAIACE